MFDEEVVSLVRLSVCVVEIPLLPIDKRGTPTYITNDIKEEEKT